MELLRIPQFLNLLIEALFRPGSKLNQEHKSKYMFLLAYASSVCDTYTVRKGASRRSINKDEVIFKEGSKILNKKLN